MRLSSKIELSGKGLHTGRECLLVIEPCSSPSIMLRSGSAEYPLTSLKTLGTNRGSDYIFPSGETLRTCEHVLSALYGLGIYSDVRLSVDGGEMPALDGSAAGLCREILPFVRDDGRYIPPAALPYPLMVSDEGRTRFICAFPADALHITYTVKYDTVGAQVFDYTHTPERYADEIAPARTFAYEREVEYLRSRGLALGGSLDNAVLICDDGVKARGGLRWEDEFARHKVLDLIGDISSIGRPLNAHIIAVRAGHELHLKLAEKLKGAVSRIAGN